MKPPKKLYLLVLKGHNGYEEVKVYRKRGSAMNVGTERVECGFWSGFQVLETVCDWQVSS